MNRSLIDGHENCQIETNSKVIKKVINNYKVISYIINVIIYTKENVIAITRSIT